MDLSWKTLGHNWPPTPSHILKEHSHLPNPSLASICDLLIIFRNILPRSRAMTAPGSPATSEESLVRIAHAERLMRARVLVKNYTLGSAALALLPLPLVDQVALMALVIKMVHDLARHYDVSFKSNAIRSLISALLSGLTSGLLVKTLQSLARAVPLLGTLGGGGGIAVSSASVTYAVGSVFIKHFEADGTLLTIDSEWLKNMFHQELKQNHPGEAEVDSAEAPAEVVVAALS